MLDALFLYEEKGFPLVAKHPFADGAPEMFAVSPIAPNNAVFENNNTRSVSVSSVVDKIGWNSISQSFMESVRRSEGVVNALLLHGDYVDCKVYTESLRLLRKFMECHMFFQIE